MPYHPKSPCPLPQEYLTLVSNPVINAVEVGTQQVIIYFQTDFGLTGVHILPGQMSSILSGPINHIDAYFTGGRNSFVYKWKNGDVAPQPEAALQLTGDAAISLVLAQSLSVSWNFELVADIPIPGRPLIAKKKI